MVDQLSFESHNISSNITDMIMFASGSSLHLCPLKKTLNMLPKLSYIDKADSKNDQKKTQNPNGIFYPNIHIINRENNILVL